MNRKIACGWALTLLILIAAGCTVTKSQPENFAIATSTIIRPTTVASTHTPYPTSTPPPWPTLSKGETLPSPLYFVSSPQQGINKNQCPLPQVIRLGQDGQTQTMLTPCYISGGINGFDISPVDGSIVIAAFGGLWMDKNDGKGYQKVVEALPNTESTGGIDDIRDPAWSPDGNKIAYVDGGTRIFDITMGNRTDVAENTCYESPLDSGFSRCFYGNWFLSPQWSPNGKSIVYRSQNADYFYLEQYSLESNTVNKVPGTNGVREDEIAWSPDGDYMLFDYNGMFGGGIHEIGPSFIRMQSHDFSLEVLWDHSANADPVFASNANNPWQVGYPFESADGRILFFQAEPCTIDSCYDYALVEGTRTPDGFETRIIRHDALPKGTRYLGWHNSGEYAALLIDSMSDVNWYIAVMKVSTGEIYIVAKGQGQTFPLPIRWEK
jgi:WD40-like Beta Propeller Repeat